MKGSLKTKFRDNILRNMIGKAIQIWRQIIVVQFWDESKFNHMEEFSTFIIEDKWCIFSIYRKIFYQHASAHIIASSKSGGIILMLGYSGIDKLYSLSIIFIRAFQAIDAVQHLSLLLGEQQSFW